MSSTSFTKLYSGILESTLWCEPDSTRLLWITMLAMADQYGRVMGSIPGLANRARVPIGDARHAIATFLAPDPDSRTKDHDGRRIEEIDGGWRLLNHGKYRELRADDDRREQNRLAQQRSRDRKKAASQSTTSSASLLTSQQESAESAHTEADTDTEREKRSRANPTALLPDVDPQTLTDWLAVRKAKKAGTITPTVVRLLRKGAAEAGIAAQAAVEACIGYGWQNFNATWYAERTATSRRGGQALLHADDNLAEVHS